jgi:hypothetical protein
VLIKDMEMKLNCARICRTPRFWFYKPYYGYAPEERCLTQMKELDEESNHVIFITVATISALGLLQLFTLCGICRSKDRCFDKPRET